VAAFLEIQGDAADHLYREGSLKASFWEALFGSSLRAGRRTHVSSLQDGTRRFEVPLLEAERRLLDDARAWLSSPERSETCREALAALASGGVRVKLVGLQPRGQAVASFALCFEQTDNGASSEIGQAFHAWFAERQGRLVRDIMVPFGFTPHAGQEGLSA